MLLDSGTFTRPSGMPCPNCGAAQCSELFTVSYGHENVHLSSNLLRGSYLDLLLQSTSKLSSSVCMIQIFAFTNHCPPKPSDLATETAKIDTVHTPTRNATITFPLTFSKRALAIGIATSVATLVALSIAPNHFCMSLPAHIWLKQAVER